MQAGQLRRGPVFPPDFAGRLEAFRKARCCGERSTPRVERSCRPIREIATASCRRSPVPKIIYTTANERSLMACNRLTAVLRPLDGRGGQDEPRGRRHARRGRAALRGRTARTWPANRRRKSATSGRGCCP